MRIDAILAGIILVGTCAALADPISGQTRVIDGDTLQVGSTRVRLWGIDAPEMSQPFGKDAKLELERIVQNGTTCTPKGTDKYSRTVAQCFTMGADIGSRMVALGLAVDYKRYSHGYYDKEESFAKTGKLGIWSGDFVLPEQWRRTHGH